MGHTVVPEPEEGRHDLLHDYVGYGAPQTLSTLSSEEAAGRRVRKKTISNGKVEIPCRGGQQGLHLVPDISRMMYDHLTLPELWWDLLGKTRDLRVSCPRM